MHSVQQDLAEPGKKSERQAKNIITINYEENNSIDQVSEQLEYWTPNEFCFFMMEMTFLSPHN